MALILTDTLQMERLIYWYVRETSWRVEEKLVVIAKGDGVEEMHASEKETRKGEFVREKAWERNCKSKCRRWHERETKSNK